MEIVLNKNIKLRQGGRSAVKMSMEDFKDRLEILARELQEDPDNLYQFIQEICYSVPSVKNDMKININMENLESSFKMTSTGVPYIFNEATSDYSTWMVFMIYWDGKKFRAYIPTYGNPWNTDIKEQLGEYPEEDIKFISKQLGGESKLKEVLNDILTNEGYDDIDVDDIDPEEALYNLLQNTVFDEKMCVEDFEARLTVK